MSKKRMTRYSAEEIDALITNGESRTDWASADAMTDLDVERPIEDDPDWTGFEEIDWSKATIVLPKPKKSISIRVDEDVIDFFRSSGKGYQTRINSVLKHYVREQKRLKE